MALIVKDEEIVGTIDNLEDKLEGKLPITREDLFVLVNSWGRSTDFYTKDSKNKDIYIKGCKAKECYDLSKLDVSQITNMSDVFISSKFNRDISNWNISNVTDMSYMFCDAEKFNQNISSWIFNDNTNINSLFEYATAFQNRYNNGNPLPTNTDKIKEWFNLNREIMNGIDIKEEHGEEINDFFLNLNTLIKSLNKT